MRHFSTNRVILCHVLFFLETRPRCGQKFAMHHAEGRLSFFFLTFHGINFVSQLTFCLSLWLHVCLIKVLYENG